MTIMLDQSSDVLLFPNTSLDTTRTFGIFDDLNTTGLDLNEEIEMSTGTGTGTGTIPSVTEMPEATTLTKKTPQGFLSEVNNDNNPSSAGGTSSSTSGSSLSNSIFKVRPIVSISHTSILALDEVSPTRKSHAFTSIGGSPYGNTTDYHGLDTFLMHPADPQLHYINPVPVSGLEANTETINNLSQSRRSSRSTSSPSTSKSSSANSSTADLTALPRSLERLRVVVDHIPSPLAQEQEQSPIELTPTSDSAPVPKSALQRSKSSLGFSMFGSSKIRRQSALVATESLSGPEIEDVESLKAASAITADKSDKVKPKWKSWLSMASSKKEKLTTIHQSEHRTMGLSADLLAGDVPASVSSNDAANVIHTLSLSSCPPSPLPPALDLIRSISLTKMRELRAASPHPFLPETELPNYSEQRRQDRPPSLKFPRSVNNARRPGASLGPAQAGMRIDIGVRSILKQIDDGNFDVMGDLKSILPTIKSKNTAYSRRMSYPPSQTGAGLVDFINRPAFEERMHEIHGNGDTKSIETAGNRPIYELEYSDALEGSAQEAMFRWRRAQHRFSGDRAQGRQSRSSSAIPRSQSQDKPMPGLKPAAAVAVQPERKRSSPIQSSLGPPLAEPTIKQRSRSEIALSPPASAKHNSLRPLSTSDSLKPNNAQSEHSRPNRKSSVSWHVSETSESEEKSEEESDEDDDVPFRIASQMPNRNHNQSDKRKSLAYVAAPDPRASLRNSRLPSASYLSQLASIKPVVSPAAISEAEPRIIRQGSMDVLKAAVTVTEADKQKFRDQVTASRLRSRCARNGVLEKAYAAEAMNHSDNKRTRPTAIITSITTSTSTGAGDSSKLKSSTTTRASTPTPPTMSLHGGVSAPTSPGRRHSRLSSLNSRIDLTESAMHRHSSYVDLRRPSIPNHSSSRPSSRSQLPRSHSQARMSGMMMTTSPSMPFPVQQQQQHGQYPQQAYMGMPGMGMDMGMSMGMGMPMAMPMPMMYLPVSNHGSSMMYPTIGSPHQHQHQQLHLSSSPASGRPRTGSTPVRPGNSRSRSSTAVQGLPNGRPSRTPRSRSPVR